MKDYRDLINKLQEYYETGYSPNQQKEIYDYLIKRKFPISALQNFYEILTEGYSELPDKSKFRIKVDQAFGTGLKPKASFDLNTNESFEEIIKRCDKIRERIIRQERVTQFDALYFTRWDKLRWVKSENFNIAKRRIQGQGDLTDLIDLEFEFKPIEVNEERKNKVTKVKEIFDEIPF